MITRRSFLKRSAQAALASTWLSPRSPAAEARGIKSRPDVVIYRGTYPGWPWIARSADGTLWCVFREGTVHDFSAEGKALWTKSTDGGKSWSMAQTIVDEPGVDDRNVAITVLPKEELLVVYNTYTAQRESLAMTVRSGDGGATWSKPQPVGEPNTRTRSAAVALADGSLILPYYVAPGSGALAARSIDGGRSWTTVRVPDADGFVGDEWDVLEVKPDHLVGVFRNSHPRQDGTFWIAASKDRGKTWSPPRPSNVQSKRHASPAQIVRQGKSPTLIFADRRMVSVSAARTKDPELLKWDLDLSCYRYNEGEEPIADGSYPASAPIDARTRLIVDYEIRSDAKQIAGYFVTFPEDW